MGFYPIVLELRDRPCLVIGGGVVAERKVEGLLAAEARITVVSPTVTARLAAWGAAGQIRLLARAYRRRDLAQVTLVFVATDDRAVNPRIVANARARGIWANAADDPDRCDFILPSVLRRGDLTVAVSTGGVSPALSRMIREELEVYFTEDYAELARLAGEVRRTLRRRGDAADFETWRRALDAGLRRLLATGRREQARARLEARLGASACV